MEPSSTKYFPQIRPADRAVIFRNGELLVQVSEKPGSPAYPMLPGGKQDPGETAVQALVRECAGETGTEVTVGPLLHVAEVFMQRDEGVRHRLELLCACEVAGDYVPVLGPQPGPSRTGAIWAFNVARASGARPGSAAALSGDAPLYLGVLHG